MQATIHSSSSPRIASLLLVALLLAPAAAASREVTLTGSIEYSQALLGQQLSVTFTDDGNFSFDASLNIIDYVERPRAYNFKGHDKDSCFQRVEFNRERKGPKIVLTLILEYPRGCLRDFKKSIENPAVEEPELFADVHWLRDISPTYPFDFSGRSLLETLELPSGGTWNAVESGDLWEVLPALHSKGKWRKDHLELDFSGAEISTAFPGLAPGGDRKEQPWRRVSRRSDCKLDFKSASGLPLGIGFKQGRYVADFEVPSEDFAICFAGRFLAGFQNRIGDRLAEVDAKVLASLRSIGSFHFEPRSGGGHLLRLEMTWNQVAKATVSPPKPKTLREVDYEVVRIGRTDLDSPTSKPTIWIPRVPDRSDHQHLYNLTFKRRGSPETRTVRLWLDVEPLEDGQSQNPIIDWRHDRREGRSFKLMLSELELRDPPEELRVHVQYPTMRLETEMLRMADGDDVYRLRLPLGTEDRGVSLRTEEDTVVPAVREGDDLVVDRVHHHRQMTLYVDYRWPADLYLAPPPEVPQKDKVPLPESYQWESESISDDSGAGLWKRWEKLLDEEPMYSNAFKVPLIPSADLQGNGSVSLRAILRNASHRLVSVELETIEEQEVEGPLGYRLVAEDNPDVRQEGAMLFLSSSAVRRAMQGGGPVNIAVRHVAVKESMSWNQILVIGSGVAVVMLLLFTVIAVMPRLRRGQSPELQIDENAFGTFADAARKLDNDKKQD